MSDQPSEFCPACGAPEGGRHDKVLHSIVDFEASLRTPAAPSVDVEKLDALAYRLEAGNTHGLGGLSLSEILRMVGSEIRALLDSAPSVDQPALGVGEAEDADGFDPHVSSKPITADDHYWMANIGRSGGANEVVTRYDDEEASVDYGPAETQYGVRWFGAAEPAVITPTAADAVSIVNEARHHSRTEAVTRQVTPWRPVDGAPGEGLG